MILGYTEIPVKVSKVYWKFWGILKCLSMILGYTEIPIKVSKAYWKFRGYKLLNRVMAFLWVIWGYTDFFINVEGYTDYDYKGAAGEKISIFGYTEIF